MINEMSEQYWSKFQNSYDVKQEYVIGKELLDDIKVELNNLPGLGKTIEFGCGTGYFTETIIEKTTKLIATDLSDELIEIAKKRLDINSSVTFQKANCMKTPFSSDEFDSLFMANLIHIIENPANSLQESHRILKQGGKLIIATYTNYGMKLFEKIKLGFRFVKGWGKPPQHVHIFSPEKLSSLLESAGFIVEESKLIGNRTKALYLIGKKRRINFMTG